MSPLPAKPLGTPRAPPCKGVSGHEHAHGCCVGARTARPRVALPTGLRLCPRPPGGSPSPWRHCGRICQVHPPLSLTEWWPTSAFISLPFWCTCTPTFGTGKRSVRCPSPHTIPCPHVIVVNPWSRFSWPCSPWRWDRPWMTNPRSSSVVAAFNTHPPTPPEGAAPALKSRCPPSHDSWPSLVTSVLVFITRRGMSVLGLCWLVGWAACSPAHWSLTRTRLPSGAERPLPHPENRRPRSISAP